ncbi:MAG: hypothetical protein ABR616_09690 [Dermatophilaceae bacterium]
MADPLSTNVAVGDPHPALHNEEREAINDANTKVGVHRAEADATAHPSIDARIDELAGDIGTSVASGTDLGRSAFALSGITLVAAGPRAVDAFDGYLWGHTGSTTLHRSVDGAVWEQVASATPGAFRALKPTSDGEVLLLLSEGIYKSDGWTGEPDSTPTWSVVVEPSADEAYFLQWGFDGDGDKFIVSEYAAVPDWADSRRVRISLDQGDTWAVKYDSGADDDTTHHHAACYDPWRDRFWFAEGHGTNGGCYFSDDDGGTWTRINPDFADVTEVNGPTTMTATDDGIVCGSDSNFNGVYGIVATDVPADQKLSLLWRWRVDGYSDATLIGFAMNSQRDPTTGAVYIGFRGNNADVHPFVAAGTPRVAAPVYVKPAPTLAGEQFLYVAVSDRGVFGSTMVGGDTANLQVRALTPVGGPPDRLASVVHISVPELSSAASTTRTPDITAQADSNRRRPVWVFPYDGLERLTAEATIPAEWVNYDLVLLWTVETADGSGDVVWRARDLDGDDLDDGGTFHGDVTVTAPAALVRAETVAAADKPSRADSDGLVRVLVERRHTDAADTLDGRALLVGVQIKEAT